MAGRTIAIGDIHGDLEHLTRLLERLPALGAEDTLVFLGDYIDRGPDSRGVVDHLRTVLPQQTAAKLVFLRGNHEDSWLRVISGDWKEFVLPAANGCLECLRSYRGEPMPERGHLPTGDELQAMTSGDFFPPEHVAWMERLPYWYEDEHAIYVHAGLPAVDGRFLHPSEAANPVKLVWLRDEEFFRGYRGKRVIIGHTATQQLPPELSTFTPDDPDDLWAGEAVIGLDTRCGKGGFLTGFQLPEELVYESRGDGAPLPLKR